MSAIVAHDAIAPRATLGFIRFAYDWDWEGAETDFLAAIDLDPDYAQAHQWYSLYLSLAGREDESIERARRAVLRTAEIARQE